MTVYDFREKYYETINGEKILFPSETVGHNLIKGGLIMSLGLHVGKNRLGFMFMQLETHLPDGNIFYPDVIFIDRAREKLVIEHPHDPLCAVPDMVIEIFSYSTMKRDIGIKKDVYERNGVREYWMIDPWRESVSVYLLRDGKYFLDEIYFNYTDEDLAELPMRNAPKSNLKCPSMFWTVSKLRYEIFSVGTLNKKAT